MARITIEDCIEKVPNRFQLVQMTAIRAKQLKKGATALVRTEDNKAVVTALREIAAGLISPDYPDEGPATDEAVVSAPEAAIGELPAASTTESDAGEVEAAEPGQAADVGGAPEPGEAVDADMSEAAETGEATDPRGAAEPGEKRDEQGDSPGS